VILVVCTCVRRFAPDTIEHPVPLLVSADKCALIFEEYTSLPNTQARVDKATKVLDDHEAKLLTGEELGTWTEERKLPLAVAATILLERFVVPDAKHPFDPPPFLTDPPKPSAAPDQHPHPLRLVAALLGHHPRLPDGDTKADTQIYGSSQRAVLTVGTKAGVPQEFTLVTQPDGRGRQTSRLSQYGLHKVVYERRGDKGVSEAFMMTELFQAFARVIWAHEQEVRLGRSTNHSKGRGQA
jgi:hypothetical protein